MKDVQVQETSFIQCIESVPIVMEQGSKSNRRFNMKFKFEKHAELIIDTSIERRRIDKAFSKKKDQEIKIKLHELMDLVENCKWAEALKTIESEWWQGRDKEMECPRLEFIGLIKHTSWFFDNHMDYIDLILNMNDYPDVYKVSKV